MAKGRTISATELTERDKWALEICRGVSEALADLITNAGSKGDFMKNFMRAIVEAHFRTKE